MIDKQMITFKVPLMEEVFFLDETFFLGTGLKKSAADLRVVSELFLVRQDDA